MHGDREFEPLKEPLKKTKKVMLETCDTNSHVPRVERSNRFVKERVRCVRCEMPFTHIPRRLTIEMVRAATVLINSIPRKGGVHDAMSARELVTGKKLQIPMC